MDRRAVVAGQFYPGRAVDLEKMVRGYLDLGGEAKSAVPTILAMAPHAGYPYSGEVAGRVLARASLAKSILLLGPNHTGRGKSLAVWPDGAWEVPGGSVAVDADLTRALIQADSRLEPDTAAHIQEHSLEVILPFLRALDPEVKIAPVAVSEMRLSILESVAGALAGTLRRHPEPVSIVVSSDMNHFLPHDATKKRDAMALKAIEHLDPDGLYEVVRQNNISMCGVLPMTLGLYIAKGLGATTAEVVAYATSGDTSGDYDRVVGYAGVLVS